MKNCLVKQLNVLCTIVIAPEIIYQTVRESSILVITLIYIFIYIFICIGNKGVTIKTDAIISNDVPYDEKKPLKKQLCKKSTYGHTMNMIP